MENLVKQIQELQTQITAFNASKVIAQTKGRNGVTVYEHGNNIVVKKNTGEYHDLAGERVTFNGDTVEFVGENFGCVTTIYSQRHIFNCLNSL